MKRQKGPGKKSLTNPKGYYSNLTLKDQKAHNFFFNLKNLKE
jgi:hypothetical protein